MLVLVILVTRSKFRSLNRHLKVIVTAFAFVRKDLVVTHQVDFASQIVSS